MWSPEAGAHLPAWGPGPHPDRALAPAQIWGVRDTRGPDDIALSSGTCSVTHPPLAPHPCVVGRGLSTSHLPQLSRGFPKGGELLLTVPPPAGTMLRPLPVLEDRAYPPSSPPVRASNPESSWRRHPLSALPCRPVPHLSLPHVLALALFPRPFSLCLSLSRSSRHFPVGGRWSYGLNFVCPEDVLKP